MSSASGKYLAVDLTERKAEVLEVPARWSSQYLGGAGLGARLYLDYAPAGADTLGADNPIVFARGPLSGTMAAASGHAVVTRSPLTGLLTVSVSCGAWSLALARTGFDALVVTGAAASPVYMFVDDGQVHFRRADLLAGRGCPQVESAIRREEGDSRVAVASIGPAGESLVRLATISDDHRLPHRGGTGAVMGAKKLKAIAVRGTRPVPVADIRGLQQAALDLNAHLSGGAAPGSSLAPGACLIPGSGRCPLPARNYRQSIAGGVASLAAECAGKGRLIKDIACPACPIACQHVYRLTDDPHSDEQVVLDNEALAALGPMCGMFHLPVILKAMEICQFHGLDPVSAGVCVAWAMECFERGLLSSKDVQGLDLSFGSADGVVETVRRIGQRSGIGDLLGEGVKRASSSLGQGSQDWAMHVKGLEMGGCDPRIRPGLALRLAAGPQPVSIDDSNADPAAEVREAEDLAAAADSLAICRQARRCFRDFPADATRMYTLVTGTPLTPAGLRQAGESLNILKKAIDIREGWQRADDWLPPRLFREPLDAGKGAGTVVSEKDLNAAIDAYYRDRGWSADGLISAEKLAALGMDEVPDMLKGNQHGPPPHTVR